MSVEIVFPFGLISVLGNATDANSRHQSEYILFFQEAKSRYNGKHISSGNGPQKNSLKVMEAMIVEVEVMIGRRKASVKFARHCREIAWLLLYPIPRRGSLCRSMNQSLTTSIK